MPTVSVIMPCFNHGQFLAESVLSILRQTHADLELIIVDDCSTDKSAQVIADFAAKDGRVKGIRHPLNQGLSRSRNDAMQAAKGEFVAFCDSDDVWEPAKLEVQVNLLRNAPDYGLAYCDTLIIDENSRPTGTRFSERYPPPKSPSGWLFQDLLATNFVNIQSVLLRKECVQRIGPFDESIEWVQDWWYWVRLSRRYRFLYSHEPLARYRVHSRSTNLVHRRAYCVNRFKVFRRMLREYRDLAPVAKADIYYMMGVDLCDLGRRRAGRRLLWNSAAIAVRNLGVSSRPLKAVFRIAQYTTTPRKRQ
jgi:glycosyltransferase involved in cell wall biosynthesis